MEQLTQEILIKYGFKEYQSIIHTRFRIDYGAFYFELMKMNEGGWHIKISNHPFEENQPEVGLGIIKYCYQLANIYHAITGNNLKTN
jgi:hypothetical protein